MFVWTCKSIIEFVVKPLWNSSSAADKVNGVPRCHVELESSIGTATRSVKLYTHFWKLASAVIIHLLVSCPANDLNNSRLSPLKIFQEAVEATFVVATQTHEPSSSSHGQSKRLITTIAWSRVTRDLQ